MRNGARFLHSFLASAPVYITSLGLLSIQQWCSSGTLNSQLLSTLRMLYTLFWSKVLSSHEAPRTNDTYFGAQSIYVTRAYGRLCYFGLFGAIGISGGPARLLRYGVGIWSKDENRRDGPSAATDAYGSARLSTMPSTTEVPCTETEGAIQLLTLSIIGVRGYMHLLIER